jgi:hypothetical protein
VSVAPILAGLSVRVSPFIPEAQWVPQSDGTQKWWPGYIMLNEHECTIAEGLWRSLQEFIADREVAKIPKD